jgi:Crinkler effector protein N-terminal domain
MQLINFDPQDAPQLLIHCWLRGSTGEEGFDISIRSNVSIGALKDRIKEDESKLKHVDKSRISLYRISGSEDDVRESLDTIDAGDLLEVTKALPIYHYFLCMPVLERLRLVVQVYSETNRESMHYLIELNFTNLWMTGSTNPPRSMHAISTGEDAIRIARESFLADTDKYFQSKGKKRSQSPSETSHPSSFRERQQETKIQIACGRPREVEETIPVTLLHPAFGQFIDDSQTHIATEEDNNFIGKLAHVMSALYENEGQRSDAVSEVFDGYHLRLRLNRKVQGTAYATDGDMSIDVNDRRHPYVIVEFKNETANSNSEPYIQALMYYLQSTRTYAPTLSGSTLPCLLAVIFG